MDENSWLSSIDPAAMLRWLQHGWTDPIPVDAPLPVSQAIRRPSERKMRLFACACCYHYGANCAVIDPDNDKSDNDAAWAETWARMPLQESGGIYNYKTKRAETDIRAALLRDIFGNIFKPVKIDFQYIAEVDYPVQFHAPHWPKEEFTWRSRWAADPVALQIARDAYDDRNSAGHLDADRLAVLADALESVGCVEESLLRHLRGEEHCTSCSGEGCSGNIGYLDDSKLRCNGSGFRPLRGPHVRGCFAVDLFLGKS